MKPSKFARYIWKRQQHNTPVGDLARFINDKKPSLFTEPVETWDRFFATFFTTTPSYADDQPTDLETQDETKIKPAPRPTADHRSTGQQANGFTEQQLVNPDNIQIPISIYNTYQRIRRMLTARSNYRVNRPPFAAYMWRYRRYTGPTAELARSLYDIEPALFMKEFDDWLLYLQTNDYPDDAIDQLVLAHRRSQRDINDPDYARFVNHRYNVLPPTDD